MSPDTDRSRQPGDQNHPWVGAPGVGLPCLTRTSELAEMRVSVGHEAQAETQESRFHLLSKGGLQGLSAWALEFKLQLLYFLLAA